MASVPVIDGILDDECWKNAEAISDFVMYSPLYNIPPTQRTEVKILYDDKAIYVGAFMFDSSPDSIYHELGNRDDDDLNADYFGIEFDTYNKQEDAYIFMITASGVQSDYREYDFSFNAVWQSEVDINEKGWCAEFRIPYSAIRFPKADTQVWGLQVFRTIRRYRETDFWSLQSKTAGNQLVDYGKLYGISNIQAPMRLSFSPYLTVYGEHYPFDISGKSNFSKGIMGGLDLKYGLNEAFTLDMTLLPDFSQVQSDNIVKNISAFETVYEENRPFFNEATDLFQKGNLFYSRRIGRKPYLHDQVAYYLEDGEFLKKNPGIANLINATKISGRNKNGQAIGIFNAITNDTWAVIEDSNGNTQRFLTEPMTNYNIIVFDWQLENNNSFYITNTNVTRKEKIGDANVTAAGLKLTSKNSVYQFDLSGAYSMFYNSRPDSLFGYREDMGGLRYKAVISKIRGNFKFDAHHGSTDSKYNPNDLGLNWINNETDNGGGIKYGIYEPFSIFRTFESSLDFFIKNNYTTGKITDNNIQWNFTCTDLNYLTTWGGFYHTFFEKHDYYEPRVPGRYFIVPVYRGFYMGSSSDYRKPFALDLSFSHTVLKEFDYRDYEASIEPIFKLTDKFTFRMEFEWSYYDNMRSYVNIVHDTVLMGNLDMSEITNTLTARYMFKNDLSLSLRVRHYWSKGIYDKAFELTEDGCLVDYPADKSLYPDFNFNAFNIDLVLNWQFAPGSSLNIIWKNSIANESDVPTKNYFDNFNKTLSSPQLNSLFVKVLYYLDYWYFVK